MEEEEDADESPAEDLEKDFVVDAEESDNISDEVGSGIVGQEGLRGSLSLPALSGSSVMRRPSMPGRKGRGSVTPYSTSSEESEAVEVRIRRRKKRKRPVGGLEKELRQKVASIQDALKKGDRDKLGQLAASKGGLLSDEVTLPDLFLKSSLNRNRNTSPSLTRLLKTPPAKTVELNTCRLPQIRLRVWPALLGIKPGEVSSQTPTEQDIISHHSYSQGS